ncbi:hypothetical protein TNCV_331781 [Trichonephila clavipes]|nr:hypothetical protein TNCV_331781 [Trichonephila clavipes]
MRIRYRKSNPLTTGLSSNIRRVNMRSETAEIRTGKPKILGERSRRVLKRVIEIKFQVLVGGNFSGFQSSSGISVSSRTVRRELKNLGFHDRAAAQKSNITPQNAKHRLQWYRAHRY